jgi:tetratricopeptide (TPR) repeat protein
MPTMVNGIGTHYYGKKNQSNRVGACASCRRTTNLESYDTRLWFVFFLIPVIPLGRKRIIDKCPHCTRHFVVDADTYEQNRQLQVSGSMEQYRREATPEAALRAHAQLLGYRDIDQAVEFRHSVLERFPDNATLRTGLAAQLDQMSIHDEAAKLFEEAFALDPDLPDARIGVARRRMATGNLDEARELLDFLESPGSGQHFSLGPLDILSSYYQGQGRHEEALELAEHLLTELPDAGQQHGYRSFVKKSERALGRKETILPPRRRSLRGLFRAQDPSYAPWQRRLFWTGLVVGLVAIGLMLNNEYIRRHRTLHVVNACGKPVEVRIDDEVPISVAREGRLSLSEGRHRIRVSGPLEETLELDVEARFFDRWFKNPVWVLNPGGEAVLDEMTLYYSVQPQPGSHNLLTGQSLITRANIDYPFEAPPTSLEVKGKNAQVMKTAIAWLHNPDENLFRALLARDRNGALAFAERRLRRGLDDGRGRLLKDYEAEMNGRDWPRAEEFLASGLDRRPVVVAWHRAYQTAAENNRHDDKLVALYDKFLAAEPASGALLYLRGRVEPDSECKRLFYRKSMSADPKLPWPWFALGGLAANEANWNESLPLLQKARELGIEADEVRGWLHIVRVAKSDTQALETEYRAQLAKDPTDLPAMMFLCDVLATLGRPERIMQELATWQSRLPADVQTQVAVPMRATGYYQAGKLEDCAQACRQSPSLASSSLRVQALLALGKVKEVVVDRSLDQACNDPWTALAVSLAFDLEREGEHATKWRQRAVRQFDTAPAQVSKDAKPLVSTEPVAMTDLLRISAEPFNKALLCAVLAQQFPARRDEYLGAAKKYNLLHSPPYHLVSRTIQGAATAKP